MAKDEIIVLTKEGILDFTNFILSNKFLSFLITNQINSAMTKGIRIDWATFKSRMAKVITISQAAVFLMFIFSG